MSKTNWIKTELGRHFAVQNIGVDLDRNDKIEGFSDSIKNKL